jgi:hypothetical protein
MPSGRRNDSGSGPGDPPLNVVTAVPITGFSALIMCVGLIAIPMWVSQQHRSPAAGDFTFTDPDQNLYCPVTGPWDRPS